MATDGKAPDRPLGEGNYRLDVTDFGPIARASVEFRPLTVFVGPSNTGKSYLAVLAYALNRGVAGGPFTGAIDQSRARWLRALALANGTGQVAANLRGWFLPDDPAATERVAKALRALLQDLPGLRDALVEEIQRCFGVEDLKVLRRRGNASARPVVRLSRAAPDGISYELELGPKVRLSGREIEVDTSGLRARVRLVPTRRALEGDTYGVDPVDEIAIAVAAEVRDKLGAGGWVAHYLPADRTGVMHSLQVVVGTLVQSATTVGLRPSTPMLSGVLADFLNQLFGLVGRSLFHDNNLAARFEENLLQGALNLRRTEARHPAFTYRPAGWDDDLPLMRASSMVSELAPVVLYLRYVVRVGEVLIIEEPEAHLHPAMQTKLARELARLVRSGVRVVLTTHSEWLLEQIGNLVAASQLPRKRRVALDVDDVALSPVDVGAWLFKPCKRPKGSIVEEVKLSPETGSFPTDYDDVSLALYNEGASIFNQQQAMREAGG